ncbi:zinc finger protein FYVE domain-containing protein, putative [Pediculus humanus corporis]|uniref:Zinc finger protein FYVE domain-containing protein, putative n=1 Tax=Pediculus humanus subsp. corporis TaxID=121224 RepID=E0VRD1_PEDHC|nr:zinc finger protein FYVE domain-containing protein, putative [Pediculus humanus corporis]EEB15937.1 zinc finger protein FYVE domain-containing protein, putative [Pediculus humanus corporis]
MDDESRNELEENASNTEELENLLEASVPSQSSELPLTIGEHELGKVSPYWIPDNFTSNCMECNCKFTMIKRRHHCRACGRILCSKCCGMRASLEYLQNQEQRVCETCFQTLAKILMDELQNDEDSESSPRKRPNPNNPMEYCSTVPPPLQINSSGSQPPPSVMVPVGVLKREGSSRIKEPPKQVMFSDGIRPGGDLTELDGSEEHRNAFRKPGRVGKRGSIPPVMLPPIDPISQSFIVDKSLPPVYVNNKGETSYEENWSLSKIMENLKDPNLPPLQFAINRNLIARVKIVELDCCMKETCWVICSKGMGCVGQDEIIFILTLTEPDDDQIPKEIFLQLHYIYQEAAKGNTVNELGYWCVNESNFLDSKQHGGFLFIRPSFQCLNRIDLPPPPFLVGILIHKSEIPWARVFPLRLMLRLGAEFRYYPCPLVSVRFREPVYYEVGHTIIKLLADFQNLKYTIPSVRGLRIHMEANQTSILIPKNRYDQVVRALKNSNDPVLALAGCFSCEADAHLVCMQSKGTEITYSTQAININEKPRKVTGASFVVLNGALKTTSGVAAKTSIIEDGLMVQVPRDTMTSLRNKLRNMEDWSVKCGPIEGRNAEEVVKIIWCEDDKNFNVGVKSVIDNMALDGVPSIRVHSGKDFMGSTKLIRWTQVFIIKCEDGATSAKLGDPLEVNNLSESIARATCIALIKLLDLLAASGLTILAVRATMDQENVGYEAGSNGEKLAPIYMNSLDNELIPVLHKAGSINDSAAVLELVFHIMDQ